MSESEPVGSVKVKPKGLRRHWNRVWRVSVGSVLLLAGIAMLFLPGPGILVMIAGLAVMAEEVPIAHRAMEYLKARARKAEQKVKSYRKNA